MSRILYLCDWLPPDYGAVGQYVVTYVRDFARDGADVTLVGLSTRERSDVTERIGSGSLRIVKLLTKDYEKNSNLKRLIWTLKTDIRLIVVALRHMIKADKIFFTGSPPFLLHFLAPLNLLLRKQLIYRISDFYPECIIAAHGRTGFLTRAFLALTIFWRKRVDVLEALGEDQVRRLSEQGISSEKIELKRDTSPVEFKGVIKPRNRPEELQGKTVLLYSGNFGAAHDYHTFVESYIEHHRRGSGRVVLWLNAIGSGAQAITDQLRDAGVPVFKTHPVPLEELAPLMLSVDAHLITLKDPFVGYVLPSKVYACVASRKPVLFVGSEQSDVFLLCSRGCAPGSFLHRKVGDRAGVLQAFDQIAGLTAAGSKSIQ